MFTHIMVGSNDVARSKAFYDALFAAMGGKPGRTDEYGVLTPIASPGTYVEGEILRRRLEDAGIRCNLAQTLEGPRILVWPIDADRARTVLSR